MSDEPKGMHEFRRQLQQGVSATFLAEMFHVSPHVIRRKINSLKPVGERGGDPIYDLAEAAQYLVKPRVDLAEYIKNLRPQDAPVALQKQFWDSQNGRLKYMLEAGELWRTEAVQHLVGDLYKLIRQRMQLLADTIERETSLTDEQRAIITRTADDTLISLTQTITEAFSDYEASKERDDVFENGPPGPPAMDDETDDFEGL